MVFIQALFTDFRVNDAVTYRLKGLAHRQLREYPAAIDSYTEAIKRDAKHAWTYFQRGQLLELQGNNQQAASDFSEALRLNPKFSDAYAARSRLYAKLGKEVEAKEDQGKAGRGTWPAFSMR